MVSYIYRTCTFHKNDHVQGFDSRQLFIKRPASLMFAEYRSAPYLQGYGENEANSYILALSWDLVSAFSTSCILSNVNEATYKHKIMINDHIDVNFLRQPTSIESTACDDWNIVEIYIKLIKNE